MKLLGTEDEGISIFRNVDNLLSKETLCLRRLESLNFFHSTDGSGVRSGVVVQTEVGCAVA